VGSSVGVGPRHGVALQNNHLSPVGQAMAWPYTGRFSIPPPAPDFFSPVVHDEKQKINYFYNDQPIQHCQSFKSNLLL
jgi:hypothetical protein